MIKLYICLFSTLFYVVSCQHGGKISEIQRVREQLDEYMKQKHLSRF